MILAGDVGGTKTLMWSYPILRDGYIYAVDIRNGLRDSLAAIGLAAVAKLDRFVHSGRRPRRDRGAAESPGIESNIDLDCRIAARVEDLARVNAGDRAHLSVSFARSK